jgi:hypothetical protein
VVERGDDPAPHHAHGGRRASMRISSSSR